MKRPRLFEFSAEEFFRSQYIRDSGAAYRIPLYLIKTQMTQLRVETESLRESQDSQPGPLRSQDKGGRDVFLENIDRDLVAVPADSVDKVTDLVTYRVCLLSTNRYH